MRPKMYLVLFAFVFMPFLVFAADETLTITTYYPSPYGSYNEFKVASNTYLAYSSGSVGIGTTAPANILHVRKASDNTIVRIGNNASYDAGIYFNTNSDWTVGVDNSNTNAFTFSNYSSFGTNDRVTITTAGNVGIGTTSPRAGAKLDVYGQIVGGFGALTTGGTLDWNDSSNSRPGSGYTLLLGSATNGPGPGNYFHPFTFAYSDVGGGSSTLTQLAIPYYNAYGNSSDVPWIRSRYGGSWTTWRQILAENANGNVGIGTTAPSTRLEVRRDDGVTSGWHTIANFNRAGGADAEMFLGYYADGASAIGPVVYAANSKPLLFATGATERVRIDSSGYVGIGTTTTSIVGGGAPARVAIVADLTAVYGLALKNSSATTGGRFVAFVNSSGNIQGDITQTNSTTVAYNTTSDERLKENIRPTALGLETLMQIPVRDFNFINDPQKVKKQGLVAQELHPLYPEAVSVGGENANAQPWGVDYGRITPLLVKSIQEQQREIESLKSEIQQLKARLK